MNELTKMGFTYDVTQLSPKGDIVDHQIVHNIIPNEGITQLLKMMFTYYNGSASYKPYIFETFLFNFMESDYVPKVTDTWLKEAASLYGCDGSLFDAIAGSKESQVLNLSPYDDTNCFNLVLGSNNLVTTKEIKYVFSDFKTITGIFCGLIITTRSSYTSTWNKLITNSNYKLLSAALFYTPIQMVPGGTLKFKAAFTLIPA